MDKMNLIKGVLIKAGIVISLMIGDGLYKTLQAQTISQDGSILERNDEIIYLDREYNNLISRNNNNSYTRLLTTGRKGTRSSPLRNEAYGIVIGNILRNDKLSDNEKIDVLVLIIGKPNDSDKQKIGQELAESSDAAFALKQTIKLLNISIEVEENKMELEKNTMELEKNTMELEKNTMELEKNKKINKQLTEVNDALQGFRKIFLENQQK